MQITHISHGPRAEPIEAAKALESSKLGKIAIIGYLSEESAKIQQKLYRKCDIEIKIATPIT